MQDFCRGWCQLQKHHCHLGFKKKKSLSDLHLHCCKLEPERSLYWTLPDCSMDRASRDTEIFSSEVLIQSNMPLQPFRGNVKFELVVVGRLWMLNTMEHRKRALHQEPSHAKDTGLPSTECLLYSDKIITVSVWIHRGKWVWRAQISSQLIRLCNKRFF